MKKFFVRWLGAAQVTVVVLVFFQGIVGAADPPELIVDLPELIIACSGEPDESASCFKLATEWEEQQEDVTIRIFPVSSNASERFLAYEQLLEVSASDPRGLTPHVYEIDVIWSSALGRHFLTLDQGLAGPGEQPLLDLKGHLPKIKDTFFCDEHCPSDPGYKAVPWEVAVGVLYYNSNFFPNESDHNSFRTWQDVDSAIIQWFESTGHDEQPMAGMIFQGLNYEGFMCNVLEWVSGTENIVPRRGTNEDTLRLLLDEGSLRQALGSVSAWIGSVVPFGTLFFTETDTRKLFAQRGALFVRDWPQAARVFDKSDRIRYRFVGIPRWADAAQVGRDTREGKGTLGGSGLAIRNNIQEDQLRESALSLVQYLTNKTQQIRRYSESGKLPTYEDLYDREKKMDKETREYFADHREIAATWRKEAERRVKWKSLIDSAIERPSQLVGPRYHEFSTIMTTALHGYLREPGNSILRVIRQLNRELVDHEFVLNNRSITAPAQ